jgi:hypothetical protein
MKTDNIYEEKIFPKIEMWILGIVIAWVFFRLVYQIFASYPTPDWSFLFGLLVLIVIMYKFRKFNIKMTPDSVIVNYGFNKRTIPWGNINDCYLDEASAIRYGGFGLRIGRVKGKWRDVYNVLGCPRVVFSLKDSGFFKEFVFSTNNPKKVIKIVKERMGRMK